jgi:hypothetical protein
MLMSCASTATVAMKRPSQEKSTDCITSVESSKLLNTSLLPSMFHSLFGSSHSSQIGQCEELPNTPPRRHTPPSCDVGHLKYTAEGQELPW